MLFAIASMAVVAKDYPPSPINMTVWVPPQEPNGLAVNWRLPTCPLDQSRWEIEMTTNGVRASPDQETAMSASYGAGLTGTGDCSNRPYGFEFGPAEPETEYCFRVWTRVIDTGVRSLFPSMWGCGRLPPNAPRAPVDVRVIVPTKLADSQPHVSWNTPDQSAHHPIASYVIERQSPPGPGRAWIFEQEVAGPNGAQTAAAHLVFSIVTSKVNVAGLHQYRVCAVNIGGRTCSDPVAIAAAADAFGANAAQVQTLVAKPNDVGKSTNAPGVNQMLASPVRPTPSNVIQGVAAPAAAFATPANRYATRMEIVSPSPGSVVTQGNVRVQVRAPAVATPAQTVDVELSWLPPRNNTPGTATPAPPAIRVKTWQAPLDRMTQGVTLPRETTDAWIGSTLVRVRIAGSGENGWSAGVSFDLASMSGRQATTPATTPDWTTAAPAKPAAIGSTSSFGRPNPVRAAGAPASALGPRP
jgi:hypothetical protein